MKKFLSILLSVILACSAVPMVFAVEDSNNDAEVQVAIQEAIENEGIDNEQLLAPLDGASKFSIDTALNYVKLLDFEGLADYVATFINVNNIIAIVNNALEKITGIQFDDLFDPALLNFNDIIATLADIVTDLFGNIGIDLSKVTDTISNSQFLNFVAGLYTGGDGEVTTEEPETTEPETTEPETTEPETTEPETTTDVINNDEPIPQTGVKNMGIAAFAAITVAAGAAYVLTKKKDK